MAMQLTVEELRESRDQDLGTGPWHQIDQEQIDRFAEATYDHQWIHVDEERAKAGPFGATIAHGYLTLSLMPRLMSEVLQIIDAGMGVNYGINKLRFTGPVPSGSEVRLHAKILSAEDKNEGVLYRVEAEIERRDEDRPALVAELLFLVFAKPPN